jgi:glycosyltransferase involved in cell wall biosynthesis
MRVVHVVTRTNIGGVANYLDHLLRGLDGRVESSVVRGPASSDEGDYFAHRPICANVIDVDALRRRSTPWHDLIAFVQLMRIMRQLRPDVVHTHMAKAGALGRLAALFARVPVRIHTFHGHLLHGYFGGMKTRIIVAIERVLRLITTHSVTNGERVREDLIAIGVTRRDTSTMIPPAVDPMNLPSRDEARGALGLPTDRVVVGFVARLADIKRPDRVLALAARVPTVHFAIFGEGPLLSSVRAAADDLANVSMHGWFDDLAPVYAAIDIALLTSDNEAISIALIEAASAGLPIVATNVGSIPEIVRHEVNGFLGTDVADLARGIESLAENPRLRNDMGQAGRQLANSTFTVANLASAHLELYRRLVAPNVS